MKREEQSKKKRQKRALSILKFSLLIIILVGIPLYIYFFQRDVLEQMSSTENIRAFLEEFHTQSIFIYLGAQTIQIVISLIPGQWLQIAAGYVYGFWFGYLLSVIGACIGSIVAYYLAKILGSDAVALFFGEEKFQHYREKITSKKGMVILFIIFLIPGVPKDLCNYIAGLSNIKIKPFLIVSIIGRSPGMMASIVIGRQIEAGSYTIAVVVAVVMVILFILGVIFREKVFEIVDKGYSKLSRM